MVKQIITIIAKEIFIAAGFLYGVFLFEGVIAEGFISRFFDVHILLGIIIISGVCMILANENDNFHMDKGKVPTYFHCIIALFVSVIVYMQTRNLGILSFVYAGITGLIVFYISYIFSTEE